MFPLEVSCSKGHPSAERGSTQFYLVVLGRVRQREALQLLKADLHHTTFA